MLVLLSEPNMLVIKTYLLSALFLCVLIQNAWSIPRVDPLVETKLGLIRGLRSDDGSFSMFMGIPYATVDASNPFGPASPHQGFDEVFEAYDDSAICPQIEEFNNTITGDLDCLHVNIHVPDAATSSNRLPVLVWIYGGGFSIGFSGRFIHGPKFIVRHDVILVTLNYRLGPYGFMCLDSPKVPGNQGLKDQQLALKWIKDNIESFGGDSNKITIFGESAGGASVDLQLIYNQDKLFDKVILQSGTAQASWTVVEPDRTAPMKIAARLGFETDDVDSALSFLSSVDTGLVIGAASELNLSFLPCVEKEFDNVETFIDVHPLNAKLTNVKNMPVLLGHTDQEYLSVFFGFLFALELGIPVSYDAVFRNLLSEAFDFDEETLNDMDKLVKHFYVGDEELNEKTVWDLMDFGSDFTFNHPTVRSIDAYRQNGSGNIYYYVFSYTGGRNFVKDRLNITVGGAAHADEIGYQFDVSYMSEPTGQDRITVDRMSTLWTNFVKYGNPTPETTDLIPVIWEPATEDTLYYLDIGTDLTVGRRPFHERYTFWDLFYLLNDKQRKGYLSDDSE